MYNIDIATAKIVNELFNDIFAIKPAFRNSFSSEELIDACKRQWILAFQEENINSGEKLRAAMRALRRDPSPFFPSPGQFIEMCRPSPEDLGAPSLDKAYDEACRKYHPSFGPLKNWSHPCVKHAAEKYGCEVHKGTVAETKKRFEKIYLDSCQQFSDKKIMEQIEHTPPSSKSDVQKEHAIGQYEFSRPGVLKIYEQVKSEEECLAICELLLKNNKGPLTQWISKMEIQLNN